MWIILLLLLMWLLLTALVSQPSQHAISKHGNQAAEAYGAAANAPKWNCNDGRVRTVTRVEEEAWAVCVDSPTGTNITCFVTYSKAYVLDVITRCFGKDWLSDHPEEIRRLGL